MKHCFIFLYLLFNLICYAQQTPKIYNKNIKIRICETDIKCNNPYQEKYLDLLQQTNSDYYILNKVPSKNWGGLLYYIEQMANHQIQNINQLNKIQNYLKNINNKYNLYTNYQKFPISRQADDIYFEVEQYKISRKFFWNIEKSHYQLECNIAKANVVCSALINSSNMFEHDKRIYFGLLRHGKKCLESLRYLQTKVENDVKSKINNKQIEKIQNYINRVQQSINDYNLIHMTAELLLRQN